MSVWVKWLPQVGQLTLAGACARLASALAAFAVLVAPFCFQRLGWPGAWAVVIAAAVCGVGGALALVVVAWSRGSSAGPGRALWVMLGGMVFRMFLPLGVGLALSRVSALQGTGIFGLIVVFYLLTLVIEMWLSLGLMGISGGSASGNGHAGDATGTTGNATGSAGRARGIS